VARREFNGVQRYSVDVFRGTEDDRFAWLDQWLAQCLGREARCCCEWLSQFVHHGKRLKESEPISGVFFNGRRGLLKSFAAFRCSRSALTPRFDSDHLDIRDLENLSASRTIQYHPHGLHVDEVDVLDHNHPSPSSESSRSMSS
jgi:hypothetical protein